MNKLFEDFKSEYMDLYMPKQTSNVQQEISGVADLEYGIVRT